MVSRLKGRATEMLHEQTGLENVRIPDRKLASRLQFKDQYSSKEQRRKLSQYIPICEEYKMSCVLLADVPSSKAKCC
jgi:hypothetical protein